MTVNDILTFTLRSISMTVDGLSSLFVWLSACFVVWALALLLRSIFYHV